MTMSFKLVSNLEERLQAFAIRSIVYIGEQNCPWEEEFDGNDDAATQVLGLIGREPCATARIRWFATFAKLERLAIRHPYRRQGYGHDLVEYLVSICREKGFQTIYLHAQTRLELFYAAHGFGKIGAPFAFSDHHYVEMIANLDLSPSAIGLAHGPHVINRPEGEWSRSGVLEQSVGRSTNCAEISLIPNFR